MDNEFKKLLAGGKWAENAGDNITPEFSSNDTVALVRTKGFPSEFSQVSGGQRPDRRRINQLLRELSGGAFEVRMGVSPYDDEVDYPVNAITQANGALYRAKLANGPSTNVEGPTDDGQVSWDIITGSISAPEAPREFLLDNSQPNQMDVRWKSGRDGGSAIDEFRLQYRIEGDQGANEWIPATALRPEYAQYTLGSLTSGNKVQVRVRALTQGGSLSPWAQSTLQTGLNPTDVVSGAVPGGGDTLGLLAVQSGNRARLTWSKPSDNGFPILRYIVQWRDPDGTFGSTNQVISGTDLTEDISGLQNNIQYSFQVAAENSQGRGRFSNIATLTLRQTTSVQPTLNTPSTSSGASFISADARWSNHPTLPTATPSSAIWFWKTTSSGTWQQDTHTGLTGFRVSSNISANTSYQIRFKLVTPIGTTDFSPTATVRTSTTIARPGAPSVSATSTISGGNPGPGNNYNIWITWSPPSDNGGNPIDGYSVRITWGSSSNFDAGSASQSAGANSTSTSFGIRLDPGTTVTAYVQANNGSVGPWGSDTTTV